MPLLFFWGRITETNGEYIYLAGSLLFTFFGYLLVSLIELIAWIFYMLGEPGFFAFFASIVGYYGSLVLYVIPVMFAIMHIAITLKGTITATPGAYLVYLITGGTLFWLINVFVHVYFTERLQVEAVRLSFKVKKDCEIPQGSMSDEDWKIACDALKVNKETTERASLAIDEEDESEKPDGGW